MSVHTKNFKDTRLENCRSINFIRGFAVFPSNTKSYALPSDATSRVGLEIKILNSFANT